MKKNAPILGDALTVALLLLLFAASALFLLRPADASNAYAQITLDGEVLAVLSFEEESTYTVPSAGLTVKAENGRIFVAHTDCPDKVCLHTPPLTAESHDGAAIVCLPNRVTVVKRSASESEVDTLAG